MDSYYAYCSSDAKDVESSTDDEELNLPAEQNVDLRTFDTVKWNEKFQVAQKNIFSSTIQRETPNLEERVKVWSQVCSKMLTADMTLA